MDEPPSPPRQDWADFVDSSRRWQALLVGLIVILILIAGAGAYLVKHKNKPQQITKTTFTAQPAESRITTATKNYSSPNFYLSLNYPKDWSLTDNGGGIMTIVSPAVQLTDSAGQKVTGQITFTLRANGQALPEFDKGNATAALDSAKIAYSNPSQSQRASTYMSFLTYASSPSNGIDGVYITGDSGYQKGQAIPKVDVQKIDPLPSITFAKCADSKCSGKPSPLNLAVSDWQDAQLSGPLIKMLESLSIT